MHVDVTGGNKYQKFEAEEAAHWVADKLMSKKLHQNIYLTIEIKKLWNEERMVGATGIDGDTWKPREFTIEIEKKLPLRDMIKVVLHEMVHVRQYAKNELKERVRPVAATYWNGENHTETKYEDQPWEIEAYALQESLGAEYIALIKSEK